MDGWIGLTLQPGVLRPEHEGRIWGWLDLMGVQRHLKAASIFARLDLRDGKPGYLADIPRTLNYVLEACERRPKLASLGTLIGERVMPAVGVAYRDSLA